MKISYSIYYPNLFNLYIKMLYFLNEYVGLPETFIIYNDYDITLLTTKYANVFRKLCIYEWSKQYNINLRFNNWTETKSSTEDFTYMYITIFHTKEQDFTEEIYKKIYIEYLDKVDSISKIDNTCFMLTTNNMDIINEVRDKTKEYFEYVDIHKKRHIFTLKKDIKLS